MKTHHVLILIALGLLLLFGISFALGVRNDREHSPGGQKHWAQRWAESMTPDHRLSPEEIDAPDCRNGARLVFPVTMQGCTARIAPSNRKFPVRQVTLTLKATGDFSLKYVPSPEDTSAVPVDIPKFSPNKPVKLAIMKNGGTLTLARKGATGPASVELE